MALSPAAMLLRCERIFGVPSARASSDMLMACEPLVNKTRLAWRVSLMGLRVRIKAG